MSRHRNCPKCDAEIGDTYEGYDPDCGIMSPSWYCDACDLAVPDDDDQSDYDRE